MKKLLPLLFCLPLAALAQKRSPAVTPPAKKVKQTAVVAPAAGVTPKPQNGYIIRGTAVGFPEGTTLQMLNGSNGQPEQSTTVQGGKFTFTGTLPTPDFRIIGVNGQPPFATIFADNSDIAVSIKPGQLESALITGSPSHADFATFSAATKPYEKLISGQGRFEIEEMDAAANAIGGFINTHPASFITPFAIFRYNQITGDPVMLQKMFNTLTPSVRSTPIGNYISTQIAENTMAAYGKPLADFSQADTNGNNISLASFRGKFVLIDFWASWCGPCRAENPNVVSTFEKFKQKNFTVLGVSLDRAKEPWMAAIAKDNLTWTQVSDLQFWNNAVAKQFGIQSIPQNLLVDPQGNLVAKNLRGAALEYRLSKLLN